MEAQHRTVRVGSLVSAPVCGDSDEDVFIAALGFTARVPPGRSVRQTLRDADIAEPSDTELLTVTRRGSEAAGEVVEDLERVLAPGELLTMSRRTSGGRGRVLAAAC